jgi:hypothetical protein
VKTKVWDWPSPGSDANVWAGDGEAARANRGDPSVAGVSPVASGAGTLTGAPPQADSAITIPSAKPMDKALFCDMTGTPGRIVAARTPLDGHFYRRLIGILDSVADQNCTRTKSGPPAIQRLPSGALAIAAI